MSTGRYWSKYALRFALVAALLVMPWTVTHVHLSDYHQHDSISHQHQIKAHAHSLADQYVTPIDFSHNESHEIANDGKIIEFAYEASLSKKKKQKNSSFSAGNPDFQSSRSFVLTSIKIPVNTKPIPGSLFHSPFNPRAPPQTS